MIASWATSAYKTRVYSAAILMTIVAQVSLAEIISVPTLVCTETLVDLTLCALLQTNVLLARAPKEWFPTLLLKLAA